MNHRLAGAAGGEGEIAVVPRLEKALGADEAVGLCVVPRWHLIATHSLGGRISLTIRALFGVLYAYKH